MMQRIGKIFLGKVGSLHKAAYILGTFTVLSSLLALMRDRLLAAIFGAGIELDIYYAAFRIPDLLFVSIGSLVSISVLIPLLANKTNEKEERDELSKALTFFIYCILSFTIALWFLLPYLSKIIFTGFSIAETETLVFLSRILLLSPIFLGLSNIFGSVAQLNNRFFLYAISPVLYNLGIILGIIFLSPYFGIYGVAYGVIGGALLHVLPQAVYVSKQGLWPHLVSISISYVKELSTLSIGRTIALSLSHVVLLILVSVASELQEGSIAVFTFSYNIQSVVVSVFGVSYSLAAFSALSKLAAKEKWDEYVYELTSSTHQLLFWSIPAVVLLIILRAQIIRTVLGAGAFTWEDTRLTAATLAVFAFSTLFQSLSLIFTRAFYAKGNTRIPLFSYIIGGLISILGAYVLMVTNVFNGAIHVLASSLKIEDLDYNILVLPIAFALGSITTSIILLFYIVRQKLISLESRFLLEIVGASTALGVMSYYGLILFEPVFGTETLFGIFLQGLCAGLMGIITGVIILLLLGNSEIKEFLYFARRKNDVSKETISPEATDVAP